MWQNGFNVKEMSKIYNTEQERKQQEVSDRLDTLVSTIDKQKCFDAMREYYEKYGRFPDMKTVHHRSELFHMCSTRVTEKDKDNNYTFFGIHQSFVGKWNKNDQNAQMRLNGEYYNGGPPRVYNSCRRDANDNKYHELFLLPSFFAQDHQD